MYINIKKMTVWLHDFTFQITFRCCLLQFTTFPHTSTAHLIYSVK